MTDNTGISMQYGYIVDSIDLSIVNRIIDTPFINVKADHFLCAKFGCYQTENTRTTATIQNGFTHNIRINQHLYHHLSGLMRTCSKGLNGVDSY